jgi:hypothetical protein
MTRNAVLLWRNSIIRVRGPEQYVDGTLFDQSPLLILYLLLDYGVQAIGKKNMNAFRVFIVALLLTVFGTVALSTYLV